MNADPRARLAARQAELIRALAGGPPVTGLDAQMVALTSATLAHKRARAVARAWPALARELGADFAGRFTAYALASPPPDGGALADGLAFSQALAREGNPPGNARIEYMLTTARVKLRHNRLVTRRTPHLAAAITGCPRQLAIVINLPPIGTRLLTLGPLTHGRLWRPARRRQNNHSGRRDG